jgi:hypothetical protein
MGIMTMANTEETSAVCSDEIVFRYMYELAHLKWHDLCEYEQEYQSVAYWGLLSLAYEKWVNSMVSIHGRCYVKGKIEI